MSRLRSLLIDVSYSVASFDSSHVLYLLIKVIKNKLNKENLMVAGPALEAQIIDAGIGRVRAKEDIDFAQIMVRFRQSEGAYENIVFEKELASKFGKWKIVGAIEESDEYFMKK